MLREEDDPAEEDLESEKEEEDSEEDVELKAELECRQVEQSAALTKAQSRELRRWMRQDHAWFSSLLDS